MDAWKGERRNGRMNGWMEWKGERMNGWMEWIFDSGVDGCLGEKENELIMEASRNELGWGWTNEQQKLETS